MKQEEDRFLDLWYMVSPTVLSHIRNHWRNSVLPVRQPYCGIFPTVAFNHHRLQDTHRAGALFSSGHIVLRSCKPRVVRPCPEVSMSSGVCVSLILKPLPNSPKNISAGMLRRPPTNLNQQSQNATVLLIREVLARGIQLSEVRPRQSPCT